MTKFHVNDEGTAGPCGANKGKCPFGGKSGSENHYDTAETAQNAAEFMLSRKYGAFRENKTIDMRKHAEFGKIDAQTDMGATFSISKTGNVTDSSGYAPDVTVYDDGTIEGADGWEPVTGFTGQYGYNGPVMHPSEIMSNSSMEEFVRENPGTYALVVPYNGDSPSEDDEDYDESEDPFIDGWMLLKKEDTDI